MLGVPKMKPQTKREYLRDLVAEQNRWHRPLTDEEKALGFLGWHERGYLPHCDFPGLVQFVTFRLADSMPESRHGEWEHLLKIEDDREKRTKLEEYLDHGVGECHLRQPQLAIICESAMLHFHNERYELFAWCVMPNHVHALVHIWDWPLSKMLQNWKSITAVKANRILNRSGEFWQREYWETFMRSEEQERTAIRYIENNPVKAKLCQLAEEWPFSSARFRDKYNRLVGSDDGAPSIARRE
jgi:REP element-mobilizing transposase RayT